MRTVALPQNTVTLVQAAMGSPETLVLMNASSTDPIVVGQFSDLVANDPRGAVLPPFAFVTLLNVNSAGPLYALQTTNAVAQHLSYVQTERQA